MIVTARRAGHDDEEVEAGGQLSIGAKSLDIARNKPCGRELVLDHSLGEQGVGIVVAAKPNMASFLR
ncbi:hypothetical protein EFQ99_32450 [Rhizobium vallis]|uniref:Uncharacterized protein n=1 Tax=Rhizobium vallis TaxID=634290 RepID=A0A432PAZ2_9HYPH|nr:hypothetical protein EFQ99_32450 [Rhizobium vallis]